jgi:hypothetical protein
MRIGVIVNTIEVTSHGKLLMVMQPRMLIRKDSRVVGFFAWRKVFHPSAGEQGELLKLWIVTK